MWNHKFEGWYLKHQKGADTIAFIPGIAESGAFVQVIDKDGSRQFDLPSLCATSAGIRVGNCLFSRYGAIIDLPGVKGKLRYGPLSPLGSDIMGPFRFFPMECRHGVISMRHTLSGAVRIDGRLHRFDGGLGYIEKDSGVSFPSAYLWMQCNDFLHGGSIMVSVARIPFAGFDFTGCICAIVFEGREYRLATYNGVRLVSVSPSLICLKQGRLLLRIEITPADEGHPLRSPIYGQMSGVIRESHQATVRCRLWEAGKLIFDLSSPHASFESVWP